MKTIRSIFCIFLFSIGFANLSRAAEPRRCAKDFAVDTLCKEKISSLRPTQPDVGRYEVAIKAKKYGKKTEAAFTELQLRKPAPVVVGPDGNFYLLDHHHTALAISESGHPDMYVTIQKDWSKLGENMPEAQRMELFWTKMKAADPPPRIL